MPATLERPPSIEIQPRPAPSTPPPEPPQHRPTSRSFFDRYQQHLWIGAVSLAVILVAVTPMVADLLSIRLNHLRGRYDARKCVNAKRPV